MGDGGWLAMGLMMFVFWGLLIAVIVWAVRSFRDDSRRTTTIDPGGLTHADRTLADRFARGDIAEDEYRRTRELLHNSMDRPTSSGDGHA